MKNTSIGKLFLYVYKMTFVVRNMNWLMQYKFEQINGNVVRTTQIKHSPKHT